VSLIADTIGHHPEKWASVFGKDHSQNKESDRHPIQLNWITVESAALLQGQPAAVEHCRLAVDVKRNDKVAELRRRLGVRISPTMRCNFRAAGARIFLTLITG
jgi:hypothetical protein